MFVFVEGKSLGEINLEAEDLCVQMHMVIAPFTFAEAIRYLASVSKQPNTVVVIENFFSIGCKHLTSYERRGLERIALGDSAMEIATEGSETQTRFMLWLRMLPEKSKLANILPMIRNTARDPISFGIGNLAEHNTLIVGDTPGSKALGYNTPFVGSGSGQWLLKGLEEHNINEDKLYWINSKNCVGVVAEQDFLDVLKPKRIICLGNNAYKWAENLTDYHVIQIPHPQFWLRFKGKEEYPLYKLL